MNEFDNKILSDEFAEKLALIYPNFEFLYSHGSSYNGDVHSAGYEFKISQNLLDKTDYELKAGQRLIHYTSVESAFAILNSKKLRLYNLFNLNDGKEFEYLLREKGIQISDNDIFKMKSQLFISSFCLYDENAKDDFNMWRLYGKEGAGLAIVFEILNPVHNWTNFLIGKVNYDLLSNSGERLKDAMVLLQEYLNKGMVLDRMPKVLAAYLLFHKHARWSIEQEYRLLTYAELESESLDLFDIYGQHSKLDVEVWPSRSNQRVISLSLPIVNKYDTYLDNTYPRLRISKIILGYKTEETLFDDLLKFSFLNSKYEFDVSHSYHRGQL